MRLKIYYPSDKYIYLTNFFFVWTCKPLSNQSTKYAQVRVPLNNLLKIDVKWNWSQNCQNAFYEIKKILTSDLSLAHFDPALEI